MVRRGHGGHAGREKGMGWRSEGKKERKSEVVGLGPKIEKRRRKEV